MVMIPRLQEIQTQDKPQGYRIQGEVADQGNAILKQTNAVTSLVDKGADIYQQYENDKIDQINKKVEIDYHIWNNQKLQELKSIQGDPTEAFAKYDEEEQKKTQEILAAQGDLSSRVKDHLESNLNSVQSKYRVQVLNQRGMQMETYDNNLYEANIKLKRDTMPDNAALIRKEDPGSFQMFDQNLIDIKNTVLKQSIKKGSASVETDENGTITKINSISPIAKLKIAQETSRGVSSSIEALVDAGKNDEAKLMMEKYGSYLDVFPKTRSTIINKLETNRVKDDANLELSKIEALPLDKQAGYIEKIKDQEVKDKVLSQRVANQNRLESLRKSSEDKNFEYVSQAISEAKANGQIHGIADIESLHAYSSLKDKLSDKQRQAIKEDLESPKTSDQKVLGKVYDILNGDDPDNKIEDMKFSQFLPHTVGLSAGEKAKAITRFESMKNNKGGMETYNSASKILDMQLNVQQLVKKENGKYSDEDQIRINTIKDNMMDHIKDLGPNTSPEKINSWVKSKIEEGIASKVFKKPGSWWSFGNDNTVRPASILKAKVVSSKEDPFVGLQPRDIQKLQIAYKKLGTIGIDQTPTAKDPAFVEFVRNNKAKGI